MKNKKKIYVVGLIFMLTACTPNEVSVGFEYETHLRDIMAGVKAKTQLYTLDSPIPVSLYFGHAIKSSPDNGDELRTPGPICVYINNHYSDDDKLVDVFDYRYLERGWNFVKAIPLEEFWTDDYLYTNDFWKGKTFSHTEIINIDPTLFVTKRKNSSIEFIIASTRQVKADLSWVTYMIGRVSIHYRVKDSNTIQFFDL